MTKDRSGVPQLEYRVFGFDLLSPVAKVPQCQSVIPKKVRQPLCPVDIIVAGCHMPLIGGLVVVGGVSLVNNFGGVGRFAHEVCLWVVVLSQGRVESKDLLLDGADVAMEGHQPVAGDMACPAEAWRGRLCTVVVGGDGGAQEGEKELCYGQTRVSWNVWGEDASINDGTSELESECPGWNYVLAMKPRENILNEKVETVVWVFPVVDGLRS
jgi:hypothetical protein